MISVSYWTGSFQTCSGLVRDWEKHHRLYALVISAGASETHRPPLPDQSPQPPVERSQGNCFPVQWKEAVAAAVSDAMCLCTSSLSGLFLQEREVTGSRSGFVTHRRTSKPLPCFERKQQRKKLPLAVVCSSRQEIKLLLSKNPH